MTSSSRGSKKAGSAPAVEEDVSAPKVRDTQAEASPCGVENDACVSSGRTNDGSDEGPHSSRRSVYQARYRARVRAQRAAETAKHDALRREIEAARAERADLAENGRLLEARLDTLNEVSSVMERIGGACSRGSAQLGGQAAGLEAHCVARPPHHGVDRIGQLNVPMYPYSPGNALNDYESCCIMLRLMASSLTYPRVPMGATSLRQVPEAVHAAGVLPVFTPAAYEDCMRQCLRGDEAYAMRAHDTFMKLSRKMLLTLSGRDLSDEATYNWYIESFVLPNIFEFQRVGLDWTMIMRHRAFLLQRIKRAGPLSPWAEDDDAFVDLLAAMDMKRHQVREILQYHERFQQDMRIFIGDLEADQAALREPLTQSPIETTRLTLAAMGGATFADAVHAASLASNATMRGVADYGWFLAQVISIEQLSILALRGGPSNLDIPDFADRLAEWELRKHPGERTNDGPSAGNGSR